MTEKNLLMFQKNFFIVILLLPFMKKQILEMGKKEGITLRKEIFTV